MSAGEEEPAISVEKSYGDTDLAVIVKEALARGIYAWREIIRLLSRYSISSSHVNKILLHLLDKGAVVELPCRFYTTPEYLEKTDTEEVKRIIVEKIKRYGLRKCGKPLGLPDDRFKVSIKKNGEVVVTYKQGH